MRGQPGDRDALERAFAAASSAGKITLFLDYDGTLVDFQPRPEMAVPDAQLLETVRELAEHDDIDLHVVSGRPRDFLEQHFGALPIGLHGEHGLVSRIAPGAKWITATTGPGLWRPRVLDVLRRFAAQIPGSLVETKEQSVAFHYRQVDAEFAASTVKEIRTHLTEMLSQFGATVISGNRVLEIRPMGINKGNVISRVLAAGDGDTTAMIFGDDRTDEDMFGAAPEDALTVKVGLGRTGARFRLAGCREVRQFLRGMLSHSRAHG
ncbi:MAG: trehalose-phosphatase [Planctomycetes bacterium]|nr:trehalose-phosphatase [Planctomycetota bacterium]